jgi:hypothetical protein
MAWTPGFGESMSAKRNPRSIDTSVAALEEIGWKHFTGVEQAISLLGAKPEGKK